MYYYLQGNGNGHIQSLLLAIMLIIIGGQTFVTGMQADIISANIKKLELGLLDAEGEKKEDSGKSGKQPE